MNAVRTVKMGIFAVLAPRLRGIDAELNQVHGMSAIAGDLRGGRRSPKQLQGGLRAIGVSL